MIPSDPEGEGSAHNFGGEDTEQGWKESEEERSTSFEEDSVGKT